MSTKTVTQILKECRAAILHEHTQYEVGEEASTKYDGLLWDIDAALSDLSTQSAMGYRMSRDYEKLYELLRNGGWAMGTVRTADGEDAVRIHSDGKQLFIANNNSCHSVYVVANRDGFKKSCQRLNLEWLSPAPEQGVADTSDPRFNDLVDIVCDRLLCALPSDTFVGQKMNEVLARMNAAPAQLLMAGEALDALLRLHRDKISGYGIGSERFLESVDRAHRAWDAAKTT